MQLLMEVQHILYRSKSGQKTTFVHLVLSIVTLSYRQFGLSSVLLEIMLKTKQHAPFFPVCSWLICTTVVVAGGGVDRTRCHHVAI